eukprot:CAMPEP_0194047156 /NCGR_PEP_ID=MMETSP0009_2-20130614/23590_1 /TAXON_ID=210454 /ORGANISM="Grammatophora oceanica, Strain CCMP 410" /LENGTH=448 /DNA_ID=CAMNT_0038692683 /DNA_START=42 /DNA_END=1388 /DNA_ORIENTATION=+
MASTVVSKEATKLAFLVALVLLGVASFCRTKVQSPDSLDPRTLGQNHQRELIFGEDNLRVASFGSSSTWGANLENRFTAFPYLISPTVDNYALFAGGPNYPSVCLQTLIGEDKVYDVILLEYYLRAKEGLEALATRLRERFPEAVIIFIKISGPFHASRRESETSTEPAMTFEQWRHTVSTPNGQKNELIEALKSDTGYWFFPDHQEADVKINTAARKVGGYQVHLPQDETPKETLRHYMRFFDCAEKTHLNEIGHSLVANLTSAIAREHVKNQQETDQVNAGSRIGTWGLGDSCHLWMTTGACNLEYASNYKLVEYDPDAGKFALQLDGPGWINVQNPFDEPRTLYLSFIATSTIGKYPVMKAKFEGVNGHQEHLLEPYNAPDSHVVGVIRTLPVGVIPPNKAHTKIHFTPQSPGLLPFRLVGASFTNDIMTPREFNFGPMFNSGLM